LRFEQVQKVLDLIKSKGGKVAAPVKIGTVVHAFVEDPTGYKFKLIQRAQTREPFCQVSLRVGDIDRTILFYQDVSGFHGMNFNSNY
jgi:lactoylglutathione lyase